MKILLCNQYLYPVGGAETMFFKLLDFLKGEGFDVVTLSMKSDKDVEINGVKSYFTKSYLQQNKLLTPINRIFNKDAYSVTKQIIEKEKPDLAHFYNTSLLSPSPIIACLQKKIPVIKTFNDYEHVCPDSSKTKWNGFCGKEMGFVNCFTCDRKFVKPSMFQVAYYNTAIKWFELNVFRRVHRVSICKTIKDILFQSGLDSQIIYQSIVLPEKPPRIKFTKKILYAGRLSKEKGVSYLLQSMSLVKKERHGVKLLVAGDGKEKEDLVKLSKELNIEKQVEFLGWKTKEELKRIYEDVDFLVVPSIWQEPFGLTAVEAMAYGRPVIGFNVSGLRESIDDGKNGFLVNVMDTNSLAEKIIELSGDRKKLEKFSKSAREKSEMFSDKIFFKEVRRLYKKLT